MLEDFGEYRGGKFGGYAKVFVCCTNCSSPISVIPALDEHPWNDDLRLRESHPWIQAALLGLRFALETAGVTFGNWEVRRIVAMESDTRIEFVAIAAAEAAWNACRYSSCESDNIKLRELARSIKT